ncbi:MAG: insulinase family protein [Phycisphaerales bacterium JB047]
MSVKSGLFSLISVRAVVLVCAAVLAGIASGAMANGPIEDDEGVRRFSLSNGLGVVTVPMNAGDGHDADAGGLQMWLVVRAGSMDERPQELGAAYMANAIARAGLAGFDRDEIDSMLTSADDSIPVLARGSLVTLDQTIFMGRASHADVESVQRLLNYYAGVLNPSGWPVSDDRVRMARQAVIEEVESMMSPDMRARQHWLPKLLGEQGIGLHARLPESDELGSVEREQVRAFIERGYRASRATLIVMGDLERLELDAMIAESLGSIGRADRGVFTDLRGDIAGSRFVMGLDPQMEKHQVAMVWVRGLEDACFEPWDVCASRFDDDKLRELVLRRVSLELIRNRMERLLVASLGGEIQVSIDGLRLAGQAELLQCVIEAQGVSEPDWARSLRAMVSEADRLAMGQVGADEIARARGSLLARWHREAIEWETMAGHERMWLVHWLVTGGRPVLGATRWDQHATRVMQTISDAQVNQMVRAMLNLDNARVLAVTRGVLNDVPTLSKRVREIVEDERSGELEPLDPDWMRTLGGDLLVDERFDGKIEQVTQHAASGVWGATLGNGVRVYARPVENQQDAQIEISAMLSGPMFGNGTLGAAEIDAAMLAWNAPSSEKRDAGWLAVFCETHEIKVTARREVGGIRLRIGAPIAARKDAMGLLYLLLDRPMIDAGVFAQWQHTQADRAPMEPIERGLALLYNPAYAAGAHERVPTPDDAQRVLSRIVRNAQITVGIAGDIDAGAMIEQAGAMLGELAMRDDHAGGVAKMDLSAQGDRMCEIDLLGDEPVQISGVLGGSVEDLDTLRATILASMVLGERIRAATERHGVEASVDAQVVTSDSLLDRWALMFRVEGPGDESVMELVHDVADEMLSDGINPDELEPIKDELDRTLGQYTQNARYWSTRLSGVGLNGRTIEDVWSVRAGYAGVDADEATTALRAALGGGHRFVIRVHAENR